MTTAAWAGYPHLRFTGVCFGHQILARSLLGCKVNTNPTTWELADTEITLTPVGKRLFSTEDDTIVLHQMHQDYVEEPDRSAPAASGAHVWGKSGDCPIQGFYVPEKIFTSQGHLGADEAMIQEAIEDRQESGSLPNDAETEKAKETAELDHDGEMVAGAILRFLAKWDDGIGEQSKA